MSRISDVLKIRKRIAAVALICCTTVAASFSFVSASSADVGVRKPAVPARFADCIVFDGIDVSVWNSDIDWAKVKKAGIDYAFIRIGNTYYGPRSLNVDKDSRFETYYADAKANGIMVGVYYYSAAITEAEAEKEAAFVLKKLDGRDLDLPIVCDAEFPGDSRVSRQYYNWSSDVRRKKLTDVSKAWLDYIRDNSEYGAMFYSYRGIMDSNWDSYKYKMKYIDKEYPVWIAQYSDEISYPRDYEYWQYTSSGYVNGINGATDCNMWFFDKEAQAVAAPGTSSIADCSISLSKKSYIYSGSRREPGVTVKASDGTVLEEGVDYKVSYLKNVKVGTAYAMVSGIGDYSGRTYKTFKIVKKSIEESKASSSIAFTSCTYNGEYREPAIEVYYGSKKLIEGEDYDLTYVNNKNVGTASVIIDGIGEYGGEITYDFTIKKANPEFIGEFQYDVPQDSAGFAIDADVSSPSKLTFASDNEAIATVDKDGYVTPTGELGSCNIIISSKETKNYKAGTTKAVVNVKETLSIVEIDPVEETFVYDGTEKCPETVVYRDGILLTKDVDYELLYKNNVNAGTGTLIVSGLGDYAGCASCQFTIGKAEPEFTGTDFYRKSRDAASFKLDTASNSGSELTYISSNSAIATVSKSGKVTLKGGVGKVYITASSSETDNYKAGLKRVAIRVTYGKPSVMTTYKNITRSTKSGPVVLSVTTNSNGKLSYTSTNENVVKVDSDGFVTVTGAVGKAYIKIKSAPTSKWNTGYLKVKVTVLSPKNVVKYTKAIKKAGVTLSGTKVKENGARYVKLDFKKTNCKYSLDGFKIFRSTSKLGGYKKVATTTDSSFMSKVSKSKRYYFKVRGFRIIDGKTVYTNYSKVKSFKYTT